MRFGRRAVELRIKTFGTTESRMRELTQPYSDEEICQLSNPSGRSAPPPWIRTATARQRLAPFTSALSIHGAVTTREPMKQYVRESKVAAHPLLFASTLRNHDLLKIVGVGSLLEMLQ